MKKRAIRRLKKTQYLNVVIHNKVKTTRDGFKFAAVSVIIVIVTSNINFLITK